MILPVPKALKIVLTEAAEIVSKDTTECREITFSCLVKNSRKDNVQTNIYSQLCGEISAETVIAKQGYPPYNASIMDGYAISYDDVFRSLESSIGASDASNQDYFRNHIEFDVVDKVYAGITQKLEMNDLLGLNTVYVSTGAVVPSIFDVVVPIEDVEIDEYSDDASRNTNNNDTVTTIVRNTTANINSTSWSQRTCARIPVHVLQKVVKNQWIRPVGCDIPPSTLILPQGCVIEPIHVGLMIQCGIQTIKVARKPTVAILSTGNELMEDHTDSANFTSRNYENEGMIPDVNGPILFSLLNSFGTCSPVHLGIVDDDQEDQMQKILEKAIMDYDIIITTGGVSMGEMDVIEKVMLRLNCSMKFQRLHMKPGKPCTFFTVLMDGQKKVIFALPGNPVSAIVCTELLIRPCLDMFVRPKPSPHHPDMIQKMVQDALLSPEIYATLQHSVNLDATRPEYHRVTLTHKSDPNGLIFSACSTGIQRSSRLLSMIEADGLMILPQGSRTGKMIANKGERYPVLIINKSFHDGLLRNIKLSESIHMNTAPITVGIIEIENMNTAPHEFDYFEVVSERIMTQLGAMGTYFMIHKCKISDIQNVRSTIDKIMIGADIIFIVSKNFLWYQNLEINEQVFKPLTTMPLPAVAHLMRKGASNKEPTAAIFENVASMYSNGLYSTFLLSLCCEGIEGAVEGAITSLDHVLKKKMK